MPIIVSCRQRYDFVTLEPYPGQSMCDIHKESSASVFTSGRIRRNASEHQTANLTSGLVVGQTLDGKALEPAAAASFLHHNMCPQKHEWLDKSQLMSSSPLSSLAESRLYTRPYTLFLCGKVVLRSIISDVANLIKGILWTPLKFLPTNVNSLLLTQTRMLGLDLR